MRLMIQLLVLTLVMAVDYVRPRRANIRQAALHAGIREKQMRNLIAAGKVPVYRLGARTFRIDLNELDELTRNGVLGA